VIVKRQKESQRIKKGDNHKICNTTNQIIEVLSKIGLKWLI